MFRTIHMKNFPLMLSDSSAASITLVLVQGDDVAVFYFLEKFTKVHSGGLSGNPFQLQEFHPIQAHTCIFNALAQLQQQSLMIQFYHNRQALNVFLFPVVFLWRFCNQSTVHSLSCLGFVWCILFSLSLVHSHQHCFPCYFPC